MGRIVEFIGGSYECKYDWKDNCFVQCGDEGVVLDKVDSYLTAFFEAFPKEPKTFIRGEGKTIAEAEKQAAILRAEAQKEATIKEAEGQAEATLKIQQANADGLRMLKEAAPDNAVLQIKSLEAFAKAADGQATKIIIPSDIQGIAGLSKSIVEIAKENG